MRPRLQRNDPFSKSCINIAGSQVIPNRDEVRLDEARCPNLDYIAYGAEIRKRADGISKAIRQAVGSQAVGEFVDGPIIEE